MDKKALQEKYVELQLLSMQIKQVEEQLNLLDQKTMEMVNLRESLHRLHELKQNSKALVPLGQGIFTSGTIDNTNEVLLNVGSGVMVRKNTHEAEESITKQIGQLEDIILELSHSLKEFATKAQAVEAEIDKISSKEEKDV
jgi:prefoldin alpha subunit